MVGIRHIFILIICVGIHGLAISQFQDFAHSLGIDHIHQRTAPGAGVSFVDVNQDGWADITLAVHLICIYIICIYIICIYIRYVKKVPLFYYRDITGT
jgi:hypothetical protein